MPNNHSKFGIPGVAVVGGAPVGFHSDHGGTGIHAPGPLVGEAFDLQRGASQKGSHGSGCFGRRHAGKDHLPLGCLQWEGTQRGLVLGHLDHVYPVWQCRVELFCDL
jgi:hypothetical protein